MVNNNNKYQAVSKSMLQVLGWVIIAFVSLWGMFSLADGCDDSRKDNPMYKPYYKADGSFDYKKYNQDVKEGEFYYNLQQELKNK
jgi:hypothetical protein